MRVPASMLSSGALAIRFTSLISSGQYALPLGAAERGWLAGGVPGTLLRPEGAAASWGWYLERPAVRDSLRGVPDAWFRPYLENYTVDASIFWNRPVLRGGA